MSRKVARADTPRMVDVRTWTAARFARVRSLGIGWSSSAREEALASKAESVGVRALMDARELDSASVVVELWDWNGRLAHKATGRDQASSWLLANAERLSAMRRSEAERSELAQRCPDGPGADAPRPRL